MKYFVFRLALLGHYKEIAQTVYFEDAQVVLEKYNVGYIANLDGEIVQKKGL